MGSDRQAPRVHPDARAGGERRRAGTGPARLAVHTAQHETARRVAVDDAPHERRLALEGLAHAVLGSVLGTVQVVAERREVRGGVGVEAVTEQARHRVGAHDGREGLARGHRAAGGLRVGVVRAGVGAPREVLGAHVPVGVAGEGLQVGRKGQVADSGGGVDVRSGGGVDVRSGGGRRVQRPHQVRLARHLHVAPPGVPQLLDVHPRLEARPRHLLAHLLVEDAGVGFGPNPAETLAARLVVVVSVARWPVGRGRQLELVRRRALVPRGRDGRVEERQRPGLLVGVDGGGHGRVKGRRRPHERLGVGVRGRGRIVPPVAAHIAPVLRQRPVAVPELVRPLHARLHGAVRLARLVDERHDRLPQEDRAQPPRAVCVGAEPDRGVLVVAALAAAPAAACGSSSSSSYHVRRQPFAEHGVAQDVLDHRPHVRARHVEVHGVQGRLRARPQGVVVAQVGGRRQQHVVPVRLARRPVGVLGPLEPRPVDARRRLQVQRDVGGGCTRAALLVTLLAVALAGAARLSGREQPLNVPRRRPRERLGHRPVDAGRAFERRRRCAVGLCHGDRLHAVLAHAADGRRVGRRLQQHDVPEAVGRRAGEVTAERARVLGVARGPVVRTRLVPEPVDGRLHRTLAGSPRGHAGGRLGAVEPVLGQRRPVHWVLARAALRGRRQPQPHLGVRGVLDLDVHVVGVGPHDAPVEAVLRLKEHGEPGAPHRAERRRRRTRRGARGGPRGHRAGGGRLVRREPEDVLGRFPLVDPPDVVHLVHHVGIGQHVASRRGGARTVEPADPLAYEVEDERRPRDNGRRRVGRGAALYAHRPHDVAPGVRVLDGPLAEPAHRLVARALDGPQHRGRGVRRDEAHGEFERRGGGGRRRRGGGTHRIQKIAPASRLNDLPAI